MVPHRNFLTTVLPYFNDPNVGFVQTPQYYKNHQTNAITEGAWDQQRLFFGPIMQGKDKHNAAFICGTNFAIRRIALHQVGGMCEDNIAEDFLTSLSVHQKGWTSCYIPHVLVEGLAPEDLLSYYKQQLRWARGSLEVLFASNPFFKKGLTFAQKIQYLSSALYYLNGVVIVIDMIMPLFFLFFGIEPVVSTTVNFAIFFIPYMFLSMYTLSTVSANSITLKGLSFSQSSWALQLLALKSVLLKQKMGFAVTSKSALSGNFVSLAYPHFAYILLVIIGIGIGIGREGINPSVLTNIAWALFNVILFVPFILVALPNPNLSSKTTNSYTPNT
jgi:cellulose synthase (UDP-forming)